ncbi:MAG: hypothetical protein IIA12_01395 [Proteobacteria bacterium]|nr:hypothetical protein [Pseudomonadota bacterium]
MHNNKNVSQRQFLQSASSLSGIAYLRLSGPALATVTQAACAAKQDFASYRVLGSVEAADQIKAAAAAGNI